jgi:hypothetical protein
VPLEWQGEKARSGLESEQILGAVKGQRLSVKRDRDQVRRHGPASCWRSRGGDVLDLNALDLGDIAVAWADQTDYNHRWLIDPRTGQLVFWISDTGIDGEHTQSTSRT